MSNSIYSRRLLQIMDIIIRSDDYVMLSDIAKQLHVSNRTVTRELKNTEYIFSQFDVTLVSKKGYGYKVMGEQDKKDAFVVYLEQSMKQLVENRPELRRERLLTECLQHRKIDKLSYYAYLFNVSEGTISNDLKAIEDWLHHQNLHIEHGHTSGIELIGSEEDIHRAKANFLHDQMVKENVEEYLHDHVNFDEIEYFKKHSEDENSIMSLLNKEILFSVIATLKKISAMLLKNITQSSYLGLIIHLTIAIDRIKKGETIEMAPHILEKLKQDPMYSLSKEFAHYFEISQNIIFPEEEVAYILMHLKGTSIRTPIPDNKGMEDIEDDYACIKIVEQLILNFSKISDCDYTCDEDLFIGLMAHMKPALNRISFDLSIRNPLLEQIKEQYQELFQLIRETSMFIKDTKGNSISEHEVGYLTLHFGAAMERQKAAMQDKNKLNIGVVCSSGIGVSVLLVSTMKSKFTQLGEVTPLSIEQLRNPRIVETLDAVVTTMMMEELPIPIVQVSPLLEVEDFINLNKLFTQLKAEKRAGGSKGYYASEQSQDIDVSLLNKTRLIHFPFPLTKRQVLHKLVTYLDEPACIQMDCLNAIFEREKLGEVKLPKKEFVLYHASLPAIHEPYIVFFRFDNFASIVDSDEKLRVGLMLLLPKPAKKIERLTLGNISYQIFQNEDLLEKIKYGEEAALINYLKEVMKESSI